MSQENFTYHLYGNMKHSFEIELPATLLKQVLETFAEQVHDHNVIHLSILCLLIAHEVKERNECLAPEFVNQLAFPKQHDVSLHFNCFFLQTSYTVNTISSEGASER